MGWRSAVRTLGAIAREAERDSRGQAKTQARHRAALEKESERERAEQAVKDFEEFVAGLVGLHRESSATIDWDRRVAATPPHPPQWVPQREHAARKALEDFTPSILTRILGRTQRERDRLAQAVAAARAQDDEEYQAAMLEFLGALNPFSAVGALGDGIAISIPSANRVRLDLNVYSEDVVPRQTPRVLKSGRLSQKAMPKGEYFGLY
jgi:hypothetical protein